MPNVFDKLARAKTDTKIALLISTLLPALSAYVANCETLSLFAFAYSMCVYIPVYLSFIAPPKD